MTTCEMPIFRRGSAFSLTVNLTDDNDAALALDAADLAAQIYDKPDGTKLADLTITDGSIVGEYVLSGIVDASDWPGEVVTNVFDTSDETDSDAIWIKIVGQISRAPEEPVL